jgi:hypothetical protein
VTNILKIGDGILFMKVGTHANEPLEEIIARKEKEIRDAGYAMWGYGGGTCHPRTMVQPFAEAFTREGNTIRLCMQEMVSNHRAEQIRAEEQSIDGLNWETIPPAIRVLGSRFALVVKNLRKEAFPLSLTSTKVAIGNSTGILGSRYIQGRVDKACLEITGVAPSTPNPEEPTIQIGLVADLIKPYAVFLRNTPQG